MKQIALPPRRRRRAALAMVAAPIAAAFLIELLLFLIVAAVSNGSGAAPFSTIVSTWIVFASILLGCTLLFGWPFHAVAFRRRWRSAPTYIIAGAVAGLLPAAALDLYSAWQTLGREMPTNPLALASAFIGFAFVASFCGGATA